jgi:hypothetical protein
MEKMYINLKTGSVDTRDGWNYQTENGQAVNAVDRGEVVEVVKGISGEWVEKSASEAAAALGRRGRAVNSPAQIQAAQENGKKGGRPKKSVSEGLTPFD